MLNGIFEQEDKHKFLRVSTTLERPFHEGRVCMFYLYEVAAEDSEDEDEYRGYGAEHTNTKALDHNGS